MRLLGAGLSTWPSADEGMIVGTETAAKTLVFRKQRRLVLLDLVMGYLGSCCLPVCLWPQIAGDDTTRGITRVIKQDWQICLVMRLA